MISSCWLISFIHFLADQQGLDPWMNEWDLRRRKDTLISPLVCSNGYEKMANTDWFLGMPSAVVVTTSFIHFHFRFLSFLSVKTSVACRKWKLFLGWIPVNLGFDLKVEYHWQIVFLSYCCCQHSCQQLNFSIFQTYSWHFEGKGGFSRVLVPSFYGGVTKVVVIHLD